jgi:MFS family permease
MPSYSAALSHRDYRRLWVGSTVSVFGDGMTWTALAWLTLDRGGPSALGLIAVCYTAPVVAGGFVLGPLLDRFAKKALLLTDNLVRGVVMLSVPLCQARGGTPLGLLFAVAVVYGLLKMLPLAAVPAAIPDLVPKDALQAANALEQLGFGAANALGPALGGLLIAQIGAAYVLTVDAATYFLFAILLTGIKSRMAPHPYAGKREGWLPALKTISSDRVILTTTIAFMLFNVAYGMLIVVLPWWSARVTAGGATSLGMLLSAIAIGEFAGAALAGRTRPAGDSALVRRIALVQTACAVAFTGVIAPELPVLLVAMLALGGLSAPMTVWAQTLRMRRLPAHRRGRIFMLLRTAMQFAPPFGALLATPLLTGGNLRAAAIVMLTLAGAPGLLLFRHGHGGKTSSARTVPGRPDMTATPVADDQPPGT